MPILRYWTNLRVLDLNESLLYDEGVKTLADALIPLTNLQKLSLRRTRFSDTGAKALAEALKSMHNLQTLDLSMNPIGDEGVKALATALQGNTNLQTLSLTSKLQINDESKDALKKAFLGKNYICINRSQIILTRKQKDEGLVLYLFSIKKLLKELGL